MKFLITGIDGFVGNHLGKLLVDKGHEVYALSRRENMKELSYIPLFGDITDASQMNYIFSNYQVDGVFNLAGLTHPPTSFIEPVKYFQTNALGTINICDAIQTFQKNCVLMQCSTPEVYGICPSDKEITEDFPLHPMNPYGVSKASADLYVLERTRNNKISAFITRAGSHTGPGRPANYSISSDAIQIAKIIYNLQEPVIKVGNLSSVRAVLDVRDIVNSYLELMLAFKENKISNGEIFHVSGGIPKEIGHYLNLMLEIFNVKAELQIDEKLYRPIDIPVQILNSDKIKKYTAWNPNISIEKTLTDLVNYWKEKL